MFAGGPERVDPIPPWEKVSRFFQPGDDVVGERRAEDQKSAKVLGATSHHLAFWEEQYRNDDYGYDGPQGELLADAITDELEDLTRTIGVNLWVVPIGILHVDHRIVAHACLSLVARSVLDVEWRIYEDLPYRVEFPFELQVAHQRVADAGFVMAPVSMEIDQNLEMKRRAIQSHRSQMCALGPRVELAVRGPEQYHLLNREIDVHHAPVR